MADYSRQRKYDKTEKGKASAADRQARYLDKKRAERAEYMRIWSEKQRTENPDKARLQREARNLKGRIKRAELRRNILELLGARCATCGHCHDVRALQIDHIGGGGEKERKAKSHETYYKDILRDIVAGSRAYQILCANCNAIKKFELGE